MKAMSISTLLCIVFFLGYVIKGLETPINIGECIQPQHEGDKTVASLVNQKGVLTMKCERHSTMKETISPNIGERK